MVNIQAIIQQKKQQFRASQEKRALQQDEVKTKEIQVLRDRALRAEGRVNLESQKQEATQRLNAANQKVPNKLMAFGQGLANVVNKGKAYTKGVQARGSSYGSAFTGNAGVSLGGGKGIDFGGGGKGIDFGAHTGSPFMGAPKIVEKKKDITIKISR